MGARRSVGFGLICLWMWFAGAVGAAAQGDGGGGCEAISPERPYLCDVGDPKPLSLQSFRTILSTNEAVRDTVARIGMPDFAELQRVDVESPWATYEIRAYYRSFNKMYAFARAFLLGRPGVALVRFTGPIPPEKRAQMAGALPARALDPDQEALRAERAAAEAEALAERAEKRADKAEAIADTAGREFRQSLVKQ